MKNTNKPTSNQKVRAYELASSLLKVIVGAALGATIAVVVLMAQTPTQEETPQVEFEPAPVQHVHSWIPAYETIHHEAKTDIVQHPAVYEAVTTYHTVCNDCETEVDGHAQEHLEDTGHSGVTTNVPRADKELVSDTWAETIVIEDAWDEQVLSSIVCSECGEIQNPPADE